MAGGLVPAVFPVPLDFVGAAPAPVAPRPDPALLSRPQPDGTLARPPRQRPASFWRRFWSYVGHPDRNGCRGMLLAGAGNGYVYIRDGTERPLAHRLAW